jgi:hypothetical protein
VNETPFFQVDFVGPFAWPDLPDAPSVFQAPEGQAAGVFLYTIPTDQGHIAYSVHETGVSFSESLRRHYSEHRAGWYHLNDPEQFRKGRKVQVWPGLWDFDHRKTKAECKANLARLTPIIDKLTSTYRFLLAPLTVDTRVRERIKRRLFNTFAYLPGEPGKFPEKGFILPPARALSETPVRCAITAATVSVVGLPSEFVV